MHYTLLSGVRSDCERRNGLCTLACTAKHRHLAPAVFSARDGDASCPAVLAAAMLQHRDSEVSIWILSCCSAEKGCPSARELLPWVDIALQIHECQSTGNASGSVVTHAHFGL